MARCAYVFPGNSGRPTCLAEAVGRYCAAHAAVMQAPKAKPAPRLRADPNVDLLPFTPQEFDGLVALREKTRG